MHSPIWISAQGGFLIVRMEQSHSHGWKFARNWRGFPAKPLYHYWFIIATRRCSSSQKSKTIGKATRHPANILIPSPKPPLLGSSLAKLGVTVPHDTCQLPTIKQQVWKEVNTDSGIIHMKHWPQRRRGRITTILAGSSNIIPRESPPNPQQIQVGEFLLKFTHIPV